jgi:hypothetical protein
MMDDTIEWPHPESEKVLRSLNLSQPLKAWTVPSLKDKYFEAHLHRLRATLLWWETLPIKKVISSTLIIYRNINEGPSFAEDMDDMIKYNFRWRTNSCITFSENWDVPLLLDDVRGIDAFFSPHHLIPFRIPENDDIYLTLQEPPQVSEELLANFKSFVKTRIKNNVKEQPFLDDLDRLELLGSQKTFDTHLNKTVSRSNQRLGNPSLKLTDEFIFKYSFIQKTPAEARAAVVTTQETLNTMRLMKKQLEAVRNCESDMMGCKDFSWLPNWLSSMFDMYLMSDQRKCGLTFSRPLINTVLDALIEMYPDWEGFQLGKKGVNNMKVLLPDGKFHKQTNGVNLGMLNEYVSFTMGCLVEYWIEEQGYEDIADALMYNDDQIIRFKPNDAITFTLTDQIEIGQSWDKCMESFGLSVHKKKPFWSRRGVFLEVYGSPETPAFTTVKRAQNVGNVFWALMMANITQAKEFTAGLFDALDERYLEDAYEALQDVIRIWGYEFSPHESKLSFPIGWVRSRNEEGLQLALEEAFNFPSDKSYSSLVNVLTVPRPNRYNKETLNLSKKFKVKYDWFISELNSSSSPEFVKRITETLAPPMFGIRKHVVNSAYQEWQANRMKAYKAPLMPFRTIVKAFMKANKDVLFPVDLLQQRDPKEGILNITSSLSPEVSLTLREYIKVAQLFGEYPDIKIYCPLNNEILERFAEYFKCPEGYGLEWSSLLSKYDRSSVYKALNRLDGLSGRTFVNLLLSEEDTWFPSFIPGQGYQIFYDHIHHFIGRVPYEKYIQWEPSFGVYTEIVLFGFMGAITEDLDFVLHEWGMTVCDELCAEEQEELVEEANTWTLNGVTYNFDDLSDDEEVNEPDQSQIAYIMQQIFGVADRQGMQLDPEHRAEELAAYDHESQQRDIGAEIFGGGEDEPDFFASDEDSEGGMFGMFG